MVLEHGLGEVHGFEPPYIDELEHDVNVMTQWYDVMAAVHAQNNKTNVVAVACIQNSLTNYDTPHLLN